MEGVVRVGAAGAGMQRERQNTVCRSDGGRAETQACCADAATGASFTGFCRDGPRGSSRGLSKHEAAGQCGGGGISRHVLVVWGQRPVGLVCRYGFLPCFLPPCCRPLAPSRSGATTPHIAFVAACLRCASCRVLDAWRQTACCARWELVKVDAGGQPSRDTPDHGPCCARRAWYMCSDFDQSSAVLRRGILKCVGIFRYASFC